MLKCSICGKTYKTTIERAQCELNCAKQAEEQAEALENLAEATRDFEERKALYKKYLKSREDDRQKIIAAYKNVDILVKSYIKKHCCADIQTAMRDGIFTLRFFDDDGEAAYSFILDENYADRLVNKHVDTQGNLVTATDNDFDDDECTQEVRDAAKELCSHLSIL